MKLLKLLACSLGLVCSTAVYADSGACSGTFVDPITDVCWSCMFPIYISPLPIRWDYVGQKGETVYDKKSIQDNMYKFGAGGNFIGPLGTCFCANRLYSPGMLMSFYEPYRSTDITKQAFCLVGLGGLDLGEDLADILPAPNYGSAAKGGLENKSTFYQMHWYISPLLELLEVIDLGCTMGADIKLDVEFLSEVDPGWNDDEISFIFAPDVVLYSSLPAQMACTVDCLATSIKVDHELNTQHLPAHAMGVDISFLNNVIPDKSGIADNSTDTGSDSNPSKFLYWCAGCQGNMFPLNGNNIDAQQAVQSAALSNIKANMLMHRMGMEAFTTGSLGICSNVVPDIMMNKAEWKYGMTFPKSVALTQSTCCNAIGETDVNWNSMAHYPMAGENFSFIWYHERDCCYF
jgi:conjugal transfer pilus assembly protein TraU